MRKRAQWTVLGVLLMAGLANAQPAVPQAEKKVVKLTYIRLAGAGGCPSAAVTEEAIAARLGYNPFRPDGAGLIAVSIEANKAGGLSAVMRLLDSAGREQGKRDLTSTSRDCSELASSLQLAIAIAVDPQAFMGGPVAPVAEVEPMPPPPPPPPLVQATPEPAASALGLSAGLGVVGLIGSAPDVTGGLDVRLTLSGERFSLSLDGRFDVPRGLDVGPGRTEVSTVMGTLAPCVHFAFAAACGVVGGGAVRVTTTDLVNARNASSPLIVAGARLRADWNFSSRFTLAGSLDGLTPITRTILTVSDTPVWTAPPFMVVGGVLLVVHLI